MTFSDVLTLEPCFVVFQIHFLGCWEPYHAEWVSLVYHFFSSSQLFLLNKLQMNIKYTPLHAKLNYARPKVGPGEMNQTLWSTFQWTAYGALSNMLCSVYNLSHCMSIIIFRLACLHTRVYVHVCIVGSLEFERKLIQD